MSKGGEQKTTVEIPKEIKDAARENQAFAKQVGALPYSPNFGLQFAGFTPQQEAAFAGTSGAASAFGLPSAGGATGLPAPQTVGGFSGYSTKPLYENSMAQVDPRVLELMNSFFYGGAPGGALAPPAMNTPAPAGQGGTPFVFKGERYSQPMAGARGWK